MTNSDKNRRIDEVKTTLWKKRVSLVLLGLAIAMSVKFLAGFYPRPMPQSDLPDLGGDFTLQGASGPVSLRDFKGKVVIVYFGYTHCPDICPVSLTNIAAAFSLFKQDELKKIQGIFISLDPERDKIKDVAKFGEYFHANILGLTGTPKDIFLTSKKYLIAAQKEKSDSEIGYTLSHNSYFFVVRPDGLVGDLLKHSSTAEEIAVAVRKWLPWAKAL